LRGRLFLFPAVIAEELGCFRVLVLEGKSEGGFAIVILGIDLRAGLEEEAGDVNAAFASSQVERGFTVAREGVGLGLVLEEHLGHLGGGTVGKEDRIRHLGLDVLGNGIHGVLLNRTLNE
jgi:hypothetical protein